MKAPNQTKKPVLAWHFLEENKRLRYNDNRLVQVGKTYRTKDGIELCESGMHASIDILDAIMHAPGPMLCRVEMGEDVILGDDKCVSSSRKVLSMFDASNVLHEFACKCAERALKKDNVSDERCWKAIKVKRKWMKKLATDDELAVAGRDAWDAAAAGGAAWVAARAAAWDAAWVAARAAVFAADWAAGDAEWEWQRQTLKRMLKKEGAMI